MTDPNRFAAGRLVENGGRVTMDLETAYLVLIAGNDRRFAPTEREALRAIRAELDKRRCECGRFKTVEYFCKYCHND